MCTHYISVHLYEVCAHNYMCVHSYEVFVCAHDYTCVHLHEVYVCAHDYTCAHLHDRETRGQPQVLFLRTITVDFETGPLIGTGGS